MDRKKYAIDFIYSDSGICEYDLKATLGLLGVDPIKDKIEKRKKEALDKLSKSNDNRRKI